MDKDCPYYLAFSYFLGIGPIRFLALLKKFSSVKEAYLAKREDLIEILGENLTEKFLQFRQKFLPEKEWEGLITKKITVVPYNSSYYPQSLLTINDPPICLYARGNLGLFEEQNNKRKIFFAIVGTRKPTSYGQEVARYFSFALADSGIVIVSGMAMGIDTIAHQEALKAMGETIAVLGCGVDVIYPKINEKLYYQIIDNGGLVVSEFPPGHLVKKGLFVARNRIISGLAKGVLVVEGGVDSGALITASYAAEQGRDVFAPPAPLTSSMAQAPLFLLKQGAKLVVSPQDILEELGINFPKGKRKNIEKDLSDAEKEIYQSLQSEGKTADELAVALKKDLTTILKQLSLMEIKAIVIKKEDGKYYLV